MCLCADFHLPHSRTSRLRTSNSNARQQFRISLCLLFKTIFLPNPWNVTYVSERAQAFGVAISRHVQVPLVQRDEFFELKLAALC